MQNQETALSVTYSVDEACFMRACHALWAYRAIGRVGNYLIAVIVIACGAFLLWQQVPGPWAYLLIIGAVGFVGLDLGRDVLWRRHYRRVIKYRAPITATVGVTGVGVTGAAGVDEQPWSVFHNFARTDAFLFLIIDHQQFSIIPLEAFDAPADATLFEGMIADHLPRLPKRLI